MAQLRAAAAGLDVGLVVYNAAHSLIGPFFEQPLAEKLRILDVNCRGPLVFADEFGRAMAARGTRRHRHHGVDGGGAGLAARRHLRGDEGLRPRARRRAVGRARRATASTSLACRAGATRTPNYEASKPSGKVPLMEPEAVARRALDSLGKRPSVVPGFINRLGDVFMTRLLSRRAAIRFMGKTTRRLYTR